MRIGHGYDVHRLGEGRPLVLGGVTIPYEKGLVGHTDADAALHALMDAILGAAAMGDIGQMFPDSDPAYGGISSLELLERVVARVEAGGFALGNADITIVAQEPKLSAYYAAMKAAIASKTKLCENRIGVKATTEEGLGFTGAGQGIAAHAVVLLSEKS